MRNRIERLRVWLLVSAGLLIAILAIFIGSARYLKRHFLARLPARLGVDIKSETNGFTYSQSLQGRTIFTVHAAKEIEHSNGTITLHDVSMVLYGRTGDRADRIEGNQFEYDQNAGVLRAVGLVHMDLGASRAALSAAGSNFSSMELERQPKLLHATTNGLVYLEKLGIAATSEAIDFQTGQIKGHAIGADYNTDSGLLLLHSAVKMQGVANGQPAELTAATAQLEDRGQRVLLVRAHYVAGEQTMDAGKALVFTRPDNTLERIEGSDEVTLGAQDATVTAARGNVVMGAKSTPETAVLRGDVRLMEDEPLRQARGQANEAEVRFDDAGAPVDAVFRGGVEITERTRPTEDGRQPWTVRALTAATVHTVMVPVAKGHAALQMADATGGARMKLVDNGSRPGASGQGTMELFGDELTAQLVPPSGVREPSRLKSVVGHGHTVLQQVTPDGVEQTSSGDTLVAQFQVGDARSSHTRMGGRAGGVELASAVQQGHVVMQREVLPSAARVEPPAAEIQHATAARAVYDGQTNTVELTGSVEFSQRDSTLWANKILFQRATGNAEAEGAVKVSYSAQHEAAGAGARDPIHVLADRAQLVHATEVATFFGRPARMWQSGSQVRAPVLELARKQRQLTARTGSGGGQVLAILMGAPQGTATAQAPGKGGQKPAPALKSPQVIRVVSRNLVYSDAEREAQFTGAVVISSQGETIQSRAATAYLTQAAGPQQAKTVPGPVSLDGRLERVIASGDVIIQEPGRHATGELLSYTAADGTVVLTGTAKVPPLLTDIAQGTRVTAAAFRFHLDGDTVEALSSVPEGAFERQARTKTTIKR